VEDEDMTAERGPAGQDAPRRPGAGRASRDGFVKTRTGGLVVCRKGQPLPNGFTAKDLIPGELDRSGALVPRPESPESQDRPSRRKTSSRAKRGK